MKAKKVALLIYASIMLISTTATTAFGQENEPVQAEGLHEVTFTYKPEEKNAEQAPDDEGVIESVGVIGEFLFYNSNMDGHTMNAGMVDNEVKYDWTDYQEGMVPIGGFYYQEMTLDEVSGAYTTTMNLPVGRYGYNFIINGEIGDATDDESISWSNFTDENGEVHSFTNLFDLLDGGGWIQDPANPEVIPTLSGSQMKSQCVIGDGADYLWLPVQDESKAGTVTYVSYSDINGNPESLGVYLPAGYETGKEYRVIYVSHGGGGNEGDWFAQGGINCIMDNLIAEGRTEEAILVTMNNSKYDWDYEIIAKNMSECVRPFIEKTFGASADPSMRAFAGLSMGSMTTLDMYSNHTDEYMYYGAFSGGHEIDTDNENLKNVKLLLGCAEEDIAFNEKEIGVPPTVRALEEAEVPFTPYFVTGSHDWFCWPQMFAYFAENTLWK